MTDADPRQTLSAAARQLLAIEEFLGAPYLPASRNPLPPPTPAPLPAPSQKPPHCVGGNSLGENRPPSTSPPTPPRAPAHPAPSAPSAPPLGASLSPEQKAAALHDLDVNVVRRCNKCSLRAGCTQTVFGEGDPNARLVFVGEAPGEEEDRTGRPFVGRAGELLTKMIAAMGLSRQQIYICNMLKCRPPGNRTPLPDEVAACFEHLVRQLQIIAPKAIVTLGNPATQGLLDTRVGITRLRGTWQSLPPIGEGLGGLPVMPTFHPAYVLRNYTDAVRGQVWSDLQQVMTLLALPTPGTPKTE